MIALSAKRFANRPGASRLGMTSRGALRTALACAASLPTIAHAQVATPIIDSAPTVTAGSATYGISSDGLTRTVNQATQRAVLDWTSLTVETGTTLDFRQPNATSITVNRVATGSAALIDGNLTANGQVWVLSPSGVLFGQGASVNVGGLLASTGTIDTAAFMNGSNQITVTSQSDAAVENWGQIVAAGGYAVTAVGGVY